MGRERRKSESDTVVYRHLCPLTVVTAMYKVTVPSSHFLPVSHPQNGHEDSGWGVTVTSLPRRWMYAILRCGGGGGAKEMMHEQQQA